MHTLAVLTFLAFSQIYSASASCMHNTHLHRRATEEDGKTIKLPNFSYEGQTGPTNWQAIDAENTQCAAGLKQSPINIKTAETTKTKPGDVRMDVPAGQEMTFENLGTNVEVLVEGTTMVGEKKFKLKQFHYHTPSEHKIDEEYYPVEVHMVHEAEDNPSEIAVVGFLFQLTSSSSPSSSSSSSSSSTNSTTTGSTSIFSAPLLSLPEITTPGSTTALPPSPNLDFTQLTSTHLPSTSFYTYTGSLTTPPCSEGVTFLIATEPLPMDVDTFNALKKVLKFNSRFAQNGIGEQNLLSLSREQLDRIEGKDWTLREGVSVAPMGGAGQVVVVVTPKEFNA